MGGRGGASGISGAYTDKRITSELPNALSVFKAKDLQPLVGSEKQVKWAESIRNEIGEELYKYSLQQKSDKTPVSKDMRMDMQSGKPAMLSAIKNNALVKATSGDVKKEKIKNAIGTYNEIYRRHETFKSIMSNTSAKFWIDNRPGSSPETYMNKKFKKKIDES